MSMQDGEQRPGRVTIENVSHPGLTSEADAGMYYAKREAKRVIAREASKPLRWHRNEA